MHMSTGEIVITNVVVVVVGMAIGSIGSAIAIRRFLDV
jgi:cell division protein FtsX